PGSALVVHLPQRLEHSEHVLGGDLGDGLVAQRLANNLEGMLPLRGVLCAAPRRCLALDQLIGGLTKRQARHPCPLKFLLGVLAPRRALPAFASKLAGLGERDRREWP